MTQEAPEIEASQEVTLRAIQAVIPEATITVTEKDIQNMTEEGCTEEGDDPEVKRGAAAAFKDQEMKLDTF